MASRKDAVIGAVFTRLTVLKKIDKKIILCKCACGIIKKFRIDGVVNGNTKSCGCYRGISNKQRAKHGLAGKLIYGSWVSMMNRCYKNTHAGYADYGGRGIVVCSYLRQGPENLMEVIGDRTSRLLTLDRFPTHDGNYTCGMCKECVKNEWKLNIRWATAIEQMCNRGEYNLWLFGFGKTLTLSQWSRVSGIGPMTIKGRLNKGMGIEEAVTIPDPKGNCYQSKEVINAVN